MAKTMKTTAALSTVAAVLFVLLYTLGSREVWLTPAVTAVTFAYHLVMRLGVGEVYDRLLHNRVNYRRRWFRPRFLRQVFTGC